MGGMMPSTIVSDRKSAVLFRKRNDFMGSAIIVSYYKADATALAEKIKRLCPKAQVEQHRDYGFAVDVRLGDRFMCACQPERPDHDQDGFFHQAADVVAVLMDGVTR